MPLNTFVRQHVNKFNFNTFSVTAIIKKVWKWSPFAKLNYRKEINNLLFQHLCSPFLHFSTTSSNSLHLCVALQQSLRSTLFHMRKPHNWDHKNCCEFQWSRNCCSCYRTRKVALEKPFWTLVEWQKWTWELKTKARTKAPQIRGWLVEYAANTSADREAS